MSNDTADERRKLRAEYNEWVETLGGGREMMIRPGAYIDMTMYRLAAFLLKQEARRQREHMLQMDQVRAAVKRVRDEADQVRNYSLWESPLDADKPSPLATLREAEDQAEKEWSGTFDQDVLDRIDTQSREEFIAATQEKVDGAPERIEAAFAGNDKRLKSTGTISAKREVSRPPAGIASGLWWFTWHADDTDRSMAAVGYGEDGALWFAPTNWTVVPCYNWSIVKSVQRIDG